MSLDLPSRSSGPPRATPGPDPGSRVARNSETRRSAASAGSGTDRDARRPPESRRKSQLLAKIDRVLRRRRVGVASGLGRAGPPRGRQRVTDHHRIADRLRLLCGRTPGLVEESTAATKPRPLPRWLRSSPPPTRSVVASARQHGSRLLSLPSRSPQFAYDGVLARALQVSAYLDARRVGGIVSAFPLRPAADRGPGWNAFSPSSRPLHAPGIAWPARILGKTRPHLPAGPGRPASASAVSGSARKSRSTTGSLSGSRSRRINRARRLRVLRQRFACLKSLSVARSSSCGTQRDLPAELWYPSVADGRCHGSAAVVENPWTAGPRACASPRRPTLLLHYRGSAQEMLSAPKLGAWNMHGSLLPNYRGRAPVNWAVRKGETRTGRRCTPCSLADNGPIVDQKPCRSGRRRGGRRAQRVTAARRRARPPID